jgi:hypothetical protein
MGLIPACEIEYGTAEETYIGNVYDYDFEGSDDLSYLNTIRKIHDYLLYNSEH